MIEIRPKDYIYAEGFYAAVVSADLENDRVLSTVRYYQDEFGGITKLNTEQANQLLKTEQPDFLFHSKHCDVLLHGIPVNTIEKVFIPNEAYFFLKSSAVLDVKQTQTLELIDFFINSGLKPNSIGVTGSILIGFQTDDSDIDLIIYGRKNFFSAREKVQQALENDYFQELDLKSWSDSYDRRGCSLNFKEYLLHEKRKFNKFMYQGTKVDISLILNKDETVEEPRVFNKLSSVKIQAKVVDDSRSFDFPARYYLDNSEFPEAVCYTATYVGQAKQGEIIEVSGVIEINTLGEKRILVGTSREAQNEYIKVISNE